jgi:hypothetical protein
MDCSTSLGIIPIVPRLPRGLVLLFLVSLLWQAVQTPTEPAHRVLPPLPIPSGQSHTVRHGRRAAHRSHTRKPWWLLRNSLPPFLGRAALLVALLHTSGWIQVSPLSGSVLWLPFGQMLLCGWTLTDLAAVRGGRRLVWTRRLQRVYQVLLALLLVSTPIHLLDGVQSGATVIFFPVCLGILRAEPQGEAWVTQPDDATEIRITTRGENYSAVTLRGVFSLVWEPRDGF